LVRSGRAGLVVLAWPCGDPDLLSGDVEINFSFNGGGQSVRCTGGDCWSLRGLESNLRIGGTAEAVPFPFAPRWTLWGVVLEANSRFLALLGMTTFNFGMTTSN
jgi:hypothetical protein